jgi:hypothetical protein
MRKLSPILIGLFMAFNAHAAHRTFVAASGTDSGSCGPTAPCRTLDYAMGQTDSGGEVVISESGGYGSSPSGGITITQSISIIAQPGIFAALAPTTGYHGINIATASIDVAIKGLTINGRGGDYGINMTNGASLDLDNVMISNLSYGIYITTPARVTVKNSTFRNMSNGILVGYGASLLVSDSKLTDITTEGIILRGGVSGTTVVTATDTLIRCKGSGWGIDNWPSAGTVGKMYLDRVTNSKCLYGISNVPSTPGASNVIALSNSFVTGNTDQGLYNAAGNTFLSSGNNHVANNGSPNYGTITTGTIFQ